MNNIDEFINEVICADSSQFLCKIPSNSIDLIITSPPYDDLRTYTGKLSWNFEKFQLIADQIYRIVCQGGVVVWVVGDSIKNGNKSLNSYRQALYFQSIGFNVYDVIIYEKAGSGPPHKKRYFNSFEYMFVFSKGIPKTINLLRDKPNKWAGYTTFSEVSRRERDGTITKKGKKVINEYGVRTNIWKYNNGKGFSTKDQIAYEHPAIFPEKLVEDHILSWSNIGDIVLDPFAGSGTTGKVAKQLLRRWILIEAIEEYCNIAKDRLYEKKIDNNI